MVGAETSSINPYGLLFTASVLEPGRSSVFLKLLNSDRTSLGGLKITTAIITIEVHKESIIYRRCFFCIINAPDIIGNIAMIAGNSLGRNIQNKPIMRIPPAPEPIKFAKYTFPILSIYLVNIKPIGRAPSKNGMM